MRSQCSCGPGRQGAARSILITLDSEVLQLKDGRCRVLGEMLLNERELLVGRSISIFYGAAGHSLIGVDDELGGVHVRPNSELILPGVDSEEKPTWSDWHHPVSVTAIEMCFYDRSIACQKLLARRASHDKPLHVEKFASDLREIDQRWQQIEREILDLVLLKRIEIFSSRSGIAGPALLLILRLPLLIGIAPIGGIFRFQ